MIPPLNCEISAPSKTKTGELSRIVQLCAADIALPVVLQTHLIPRNQRSSTPTHITLHLPAAIASTQHQAWCLTCRIACFCPDVRVSVLVHGAEAFDPMLTPVPAEETDVLLALWA